MNRCAPFFPLARACCVAAALAATAWPALAQTTAVVAIRQFPPKAVRGTLLVVAPPEVVMDGKKDRLSPGSRIRGANNIMVMSGALVGQTVVVNYTREPTGMIHDVWILSADEIRLLPVPAPAPALPVVTQ
jgi:hypothetical protein